MNRETLALLRTFVPGAYLRAVAVGNLKCAGYELGFTEEEVDEVITTWMAWYSTMPYAFDPERVRKSFEVRVQGGSWKPPVMVLDGEPL